MAPMAGPTGVQRHREIQHQDYFLELPSAVNAFVVFEVFPDNVEALGLDTVEREQQASAASCVLTRDGNNVVVKELLQLRQHGSCLRAGEASLDLFLATVARPGPF
jgi:hypothetical protein